MFDYLSLLAEQNKLIIILVNKMMSLEPIFTYLIYFVMHYFCAYHCFKILTYVEEQRIIIKIQVENRHSNNDN